MNATHHLLTIATLGGFLVFYVALGLGLCRMAALGDRDDR